MVLHISLYQIMDWQDYYTKELCKSYHVFSTKMQVLSKCFVFQEGGLNTSGETEADIPKFITDSNDKTSYVRGKFLGKVSLHRYCMRDTSSKPQ